MVGSTRILTVVYTWKIFLAISKSTSLLTAKYSSSSKRDCVWHCCYYWWLVDDFWIVRPATVAQFDAVIDLDFLWVICGGSAACLVHQNSVLDEIPCKTQGGTNAESDGEASSLLLLLQQHFDVWNIWYRNNSTSRLSEFSWNWPCISQLMVVQSILHAVVISLQSVYLLQLFVFAAFAVHIFSLLEH